MPTEPFRVAVVTPYFRTPDDWLRQCHHSVRAQKHPTTHILVADGEPQVCVKSFEAQHLVLPVSHSDYGSTPRAAGAMSAIGQRFDAIAFLDADNWISPDHIASLVALHEQTGAAICTSKRLLHRLDGSLMALDLTSDGEQFCDTSCMMFVGSAFSLVPNWVLMNHDEHAIGDRIVWYRIRKSGLKRAHTDKPTVHYRATHVAMYEDLGEPVPPAAKDNSAIKEGLKNWYLRGNESLSFVASYRVPSNHPKAKATLNG